MIEPKRTLTGHQSNELNKAIEVGVLDEAGPGGACRHYAIKLERNATDHVKDPHHNYWELKFQDGDPSVAKNGITSEALLELLIDRHSGFQRGRFKSKEGGVALKHLQAALAALQARTKERAKRGVEGKLKK